MYGPSDCEHTLITAAQLRAARALIGMDQRAIAHTAGLSLPTIQRMEASEGIVRGTVDSLMKVVAALNAAGVELINEGDTSAPGGRGVRLLEAAVGRGAGRSRTQESRAPVVIQGRRRGA